MDSIDLKEEYFRQYMLEIASVENLTLEDCVYSWRINKHLIQDLDDVDRIIDDLKWFE